jgi:fucose permease
MDGTVSPELPRHGAGGAVAVAPYSDRLVFAAACAGMFSFAVTQSCVAAILPPVIRRFELDLVAAGALLTLLTFGVLLGSLVFGPVADRYGYRGLLLLSAGMLLAGMEWLAVAPSPGSLRAAVVLVGAGGGVINGAASALVSDISAEGRGARLSMLGIFFGIGAMGAPAAVGALLDRFGYGPVVAGLGAVVVPFLVLTGVIRFPVPKRSEGISAREALQLLRQPPLILLGAMLLLESGLETTMGGWTAPFFQEEYGIRTDHALLYITLFWSGLMLARFLHGTVLHALPIFLAISASLATAVTGGAVMTLAPHVAVATAGTFLVGMGCGGVFPLVLALVGDRYAAASGTAFGIAFTMALLGGMLLPFTAGVLGSAFGMRAALAIVPLGLSCSLGLLAAVRGR